jgi:hypothetical protein
MNENKDLNNYFFINDLLTSKKWLDLSNVMKLDRIFPININLKIN